jgi:hypothetical protein
VKGIFTQTSGFGNSKSLPAPACGRQGRQANIESRNKFETQINAIEVLDASLS